MGKLPPDFMSLHLAYESGARDKFEQICTELMHAKYGADACRIVPRGGDWGIDVIIGNFSSPCTVCQCKFFSENIGDAQKSQIRASFQRAVNSEAYTMERWILCLANDMDPPEEQWWSGWQEEQAKKYGVKIELYAGTSLLSALKEAHVYERFFGKQLICPFYNNTLSGFGRSGLFLIDDAAVNAHSRPSDLRIVRAFRRITPELENILYAVCSNAASECVLEDASLTLVDHLAREIQDGSQMVLLLGNGGIGKTTALVQTAVRVRAPDRRVYLLQLGRPQNQDGIALEQIRRSIIRDRERDSKYSHLIFIDSPYANSEILGDFLEEIQFDQNVQVIVSERLNRFGPIADDLTRGIYQETIRVIRIGFTNKKGVIPLVLKSQITDLKMSVSWKRQVVLDMFRSIPGVDVSKVEPAIAGEKGMSIVELYLRACITYNRLVDGDQNLPATVKVNLDWDEWTNLVRACPNCTPQESVQLESVFQIVAALDLFKVKASLKLLSHKTGIPEDRLDRVFRSLLTMASYEPMWYEAGGDTPYLELKHDVISYLYFEETGISPQITLESLIGSLRDREAIVSFEKQVFKRRYIQSKRGGGPPLGVNVKRLYELFAAQEGFYTVLSRAGRAYSFDLARVWMIDVQGDGRAFASEAWSVLLQEYDTSEPMLRRKVYMCCRDDCRRRGIPFPQQLLPDDGFLYTEAFEAAKAGTDMTRLKSIWSNKLDSIYQTAAGEEDIVFEWRKGFFDYILTGFEMPEQFFNVLDHVSYQMIDLTYANLEPYVKRNRLDTRRYYSLGISLYAAIAERNPTDIPSRMHLAYCYEHLGDYGQAKAIYEELLPGNPRHYTVYNALAALCALWLKEKWKDLADDPERKRELSALYETSIRNAIRFSEDNIDKARCYAVWGTYLFRTARKFQESYDVLKKGLDYFELHSLRVELGMLCGTFSKGNPCCSIEESEEHFRRALELNCTPIERLSALVPYGNMLYCTGRLEEAAAQYKKASELGEARADRMTERIQRESRVLLKTAEYRPRLFATLRDAGEAIRHDPEILSDMGKRLDVLSMLLNTVSGGSTEDAGYGLISLMVKTLRQARHPNWKKDLIWFRVLQRAEEFCAKDSFYTKRARENFRSQCFFINRSIKHGGEYDLQLEEYEAYLAQSLHAALSAQSS